MENITLCGKLCKNGKSCELRIPHRGSCSNSFCTICGVGDKACGNRTKCAACQSKYNAAYFANRYHNDDAFKVAHKQYVNRPEWLTVRSHWRYIFYETKKGRCIGYLGMPFYPDWNPKEGGSYENGEKWILENLGPRPASHWSMDIIRHELGFVPGNLRWALKNMQGLNKQHRQLGQISDEEFSIEAKRRGYERKDLTKTCQCATMVR